jgi:hypothetical protein
MKVEADIKTTHCGNYCHYKCQFLDTFKVNHKVKYKCNRFNKEIINSGKRKWHRLFQCHMEGPSK